jgi:hypothetical protein
LVCHASVVAAKGVFAGLRNVKAVVVALIRYWRGVTLDGVPRMWYWGPGSRAQDIRGRGGLHCAKWRAVKVRRKTFYESSYCTIIVKAGYDCSWAE